MEENLSFMLWPDPYHDPCSSLVGASDGVLRVSITDFGNDFLLLYIMIGLFVN